MKMILEWFSHPLIMTRQKFIIALRDAEQAADLLSQRLIVNRVVIVFFLFCFNYCLLTLLTNNK